MRVWNQVYVLSVRPEFQQVTLGTWGNPEAGFGGFSDKPETCQVRRLLVMRDNITQLVRREASGPAEWELIKEQLKSLTCKINLPDDWDSARTVNHWIPNTAGGLGNIKIELAGTNAEEGQGASLPLDGFNIVFLPPADQFFDKLSQEIVATEKSNIAVNKGTGIEIWAEGIDTDGIKITDAAGKVSEYKLVTFSRKPFGDSDLKDDNPVYGGDNKKLGRAYYREPVFEAAYFDATGKGKNNYRLHTEDIAVTESGAGKSYKQCLVLEGNFGGQVRKLYRFKIKAIADASIRPGDDFLLRFGVVEAPGVAATAGNGEFVAVYDHKMLWRANLYIDERVRDSTGNLIPPGAAGYKLQDWNDLHPWIEGNEWNIPDSTMQIPGGQVIQIGAWTKFHDNATVKNTVAYGWGAVDTPLDFNSDLNMQKSILDLAIKNGLEGYSSNSGGWNKSTAPASKSNPSATGEGIWLNYIFGVKTTGGSAGDYYYIYSRKDLLGIKYTPPVPGLSTYHYRENNSTDPNGMYEFNQVAYTAGLDCGGLVQTSSAYTGNPYGMHAVERIILVPDYTWDNQKTNTIIPGDLLEDLNKDHIVIVMSVTYEVTNRNVLETNVTVIESTGTENKWCVVNINHWGDVYNNYKIFRLKNILQ